MGRKHELEERKKRFQGFTVTPKLMAPMPSPMPSSCTACLPARRGLEATDAGIESNAAIVFPQAENRMHAQNAIMLKVAGLA